MFLYFVFNVRLVGLFVSPVTTPVNILAFGIHYFVNIFSVLALEDLGSNDKEGHEGSSYQLCPTDPRTHRPRDSATNSQNIHPLSTLVINLLP